MISSVTNAWVNARALEWRAFAKRLAAGGSKPRTMSDAMTMLRTYQDLARDLSTARRLIPGTQITRGLQALFTQAHGVIYRPPPSSWRGVLAALRYDVPAVTAELMPRILWMAFLMTVSGAAGWWLITAHPQLISLIASEQMIDNVDDGKLWTDGLINVTPSSILSIRIFANNIAVSLMAACCGIFFGLGTFYLIGLNGLMLGATFAFVHQHAMAGRLFTFIVAHGLVELSVICISGAIGTSIGEVLIRPTHASRLESFQTAVRRVTPLLGVCAVLLVLAGLIEGFVSPDDTFPLPSRIVIGVAYWVLMVLALSGRLWRSVRP